MSFLGALFARPQAGYQPWDDYWYEAPGTAVSSGVSVTRKTVLKIPAVLQAVRLISDGVAGLPMGTFTKVEGSPRERPLPMWLKRPNPNLETRYELVQQWLTSLLVDNNAYSILVRDSRGNIGEVWPQDWSNVTVFEDRKTKALTYAIENEEYAASQVLHIRGFSLPGSVVGASVVDLLAESFGLALAVEKYAALYFGQGATGSHLLTTAGGNPELVKALEDSVNRKWGGVANAWKVKVLGQAADTKLHTLTMPNDESQMLETRVHQVIETARAFNVPPHLLYEMTKETTWGSGIEQQGIGFVVYTLRPWLERLEQKLFWYLPRPQYLKWNVSGLLRGDMAARFNAYRQALTDPAWMTVDEIRDLEELPPLQDQLQQYQQALTA